MCLFFFAANFFTEQFAPSEMFTADAIGHPHRKAACFEKILNMFRNIK
jgi:hypothetical protein